MVTDQNMSTFSAKAMISTPHERLIDAANDNGGTDNITVILIRCLDESH